MWWWIKRIAFRIFIAVLLGLLAFLVWLAINFRFPPSGNEPLVEVKHEITFFVEPLKENGDVDYLEALNQHFSAGVTPENNAVNKFIEVLIQNVHGHDLEPLFERVGFDKRNLSETPFVGFEKWLEDYQEANKEEPLKSRVEFEYARTQPWTPEQFPSLNLWVEKNEPALRIIDEGLERERYFYPLLGNPGGLKDPPVTPSFHAVFRDLNSPVMSSLLFLFQELENVATCLEIRAMRSLGAGDSAKAFQDLKRLYLLSELYHQAASCTERHHAVKLGERAFRKMCVLATTDSVSEAELKLIFDQVKKMLPTSSLVESFDITDRAMVLDDFVHSVRYGEPYFAQAFKDSSESMKYINNWYDELVDILSIENDLERKNRSLLLLSTFDESDDAVASKHRITGWSSRKAVGKYWGRTVINKVTGDFDLQVDTEIRTKSAYRQARIVLAAEILRRRNGTYPESINELKPFFDGELPPDPFSNEPLYYEAVDGEIRVGSRANSEIEINNTALSWEEFREENE